MDHNGKGVLTDKADLHKESIFNEEGNHAGGQDAAGQGTEVYKEADKNLNSEGDRPEAAGSIGPGSGEVKEEAEEGAGAEGQTEAENERKPQSYSGGNTGINAGMPQNYGQGNHEADAGMPRNYGQGNHEAGEGILQDYGRENREAGAGMPQDYGQGNSGQNAGMPQGYGRGNSGQNAGMPQGYGRGNSGQNAGMPQGYGRGNHGQNAGMPPYYEQGNRGQYAGMPSSHGRMNQGQNMAPGSGYAGGGQGRYLHDAVSRMQEPYRPGHYYDRNTYPYPEQGGYGQDAEIPLTVGEWLINMLLMLIPCVNIILMLVWAFGDKEKKGKSNYYKARLIFWGILIGILFLWSCFYGMIVWILR